ncbi:MAG: LolA family protein [Blastocatellia bacterium]
MRFDQRRVRWVELSFAMLMLLLPASAANRGAAGRPPTVDQVLSHMHQSSLKLNTIEAKIVQEVRHTDIGGHEIYQGELYFEHSKTDKLRVKYWTDGKVSQDVLVTGEQISLYQPIAKQVLQTTKRAQAAKDQEFDFITTPYSSVSSLKSRYRIDYPTDEDKIAPTAKSVDGVATVILTLAPRKPGSVKRVVLSINPNSWVPVRYEVEDENKVISFTLTNVKLGQKKLPGECWNQKIAKVPTE